MTTEFDSAAQSAETSSNPKRRRAVSREAGAPRPVDNDTTTTPTELPVAAGSASATIVVGASKAPKRRAARRAVSSPDLAATAQPTPAAQLPVVAAHASPATGTPDTPRSTTEAKPAPKAPATADAQTKEARQEAADNSEAPSAAENQDNSDDKPKTGRRRSRSRRGGRNRRTETTAPATTDGDEPASTQQAAPAQAADNVTAEPTTDDAPATPSAPPALPAAVASPFLLFQAPEPIAEPPAPAQPVADRDEDSDDADDEATGSSSDNDTDDSDDDSNSRRRRRRRGGRGRRRRTEEATDSETSNEDSEDTDSPAEVDSPQDAAESSESDDSDEGTTSRRRRRRRRTSSPSGDSDQVTSVKGSTRLEAKRQRRRDGRESGRRRQVVSEAEFLARRESVERSMVVREGEGRTQVAVLEDGVLVEHYVARKSQKSMIGNVYVGRVQNVLPSMEAAFVDIGKGRNAVLYAGEVNWDAAGLDGQPRRIESALKSGDPVVAQVTKDPVGHKGPRLTSQVSLPGRYLVFVPGRVMTGISRKLPDTERARLKKILKSIVPEDAGVIVRTAAEGASEEELTRDIERLQKQWDRIQKKIKSANPPALLYQEPSLAVKIIRDVFNEDFKELTVAGEEAWNTVSTYVSELAPDLAERVHPWDPSKGDVFEVLRLDEQISKAMERTVYLPSGGSLVIDRTEAMTVVDVNTGRFTGSGGNLEATVTKNNLEAAEEIVRQLRLRDIGGIIVVDFIDMVLESNRDLVLRRLLECLSRDRTKHQVAEVTSLGLVQMTRKRIGQGLLEVFSEPCSHCDGRGSIVHQVKGFSASTVSLSEDEEREQYERRRAEQAAAVARVAAASSPTAADQDAASDEDSTDAAVSADAAAATGDETTAAEATDTSGDASSSEAADNDTDRGNGKERSRSSRRRRSPSGRRRGRKSAVPATEGDGDTTSEAAAEANTGVAEVSSGEDSDAAAETTPEASGGSNVAVFIEQAHSPTPPAESGAATTAVDTPSLELAFAAPSDQVTRSPFATTASDAQDSLSTGETDKSDTPTEE